LKFLNSFPHHDRQSLSKKFPDLDSTVIDFLDHVLVYDPKVRFTACEALEHPYMEEFHDPDDEPCADTVLDWKMIESQRSVEEWRELIVSEVDDFQQQQ
jgi:p38 MAP kinase